MVLVVIKIYLLFYMCHFAMGLTHCYKTTVILHLHTIDTVLIKQTVCVLTHMSIRHTEEGAHYPRAIDIADGCDVATGAVLTYCSAH